MTTTATADGVASDPDPRHPAPSAPVLGVPVTVAGGRYRLERLLGAGGMGIVHAAHDQLLGRDVAVKLLADNLAADPESRARFEREARAAARLTHPHVVSVFDVGEETGRPYFVMELVDGPSLAERLRARGTLPATEVIAIAIHGLRALHAAHTAGVLHRDLKPANLLLAADGTVKVTDFGVAQATELPQMTRTGLVLGTLPYLAPERSTGTPASVRSDLYAFGATLLELLTGRPPDTTQADGGTPVHDPVELDTAPPHLAGLIQRCLARDPDGRPASAQAALELLGPAGQVSGAGGVGDTQVLPGPADVTTVAVEPDASPRTVTAADDRRARAFPARRRARWLPLVGLAGLLVAALIGLSGESPSPTAPSPGAGAASTADPGDAAGSDRAAATVRELRDWILDQAG